MAPCDAGGGLSSRFRKVVLADKRGDCAPIQGPIQPDVDLVAHPVSLNLPRRRLLQLELRRGLSTSRWSSVMAAAPQELPARNRT